MAIEKKWSAVPPRLFTVDGSANGLVTVSSTAGFKVKQAIVIAGTALPNLALQVKRVNSPNTLIVGLINPPQGQAFKGVDISLYTTAANSYIYAEEQEKAKLKPDDIVQAVYDQEPAVAIRTLLVDQYGNYYDDNNPLPTSGGGSGGGGGLAPSNFDEVDIIYNVNQDPEQYQFYLASVLVGAIDVTYDLNLNPIQYKKV